tara:strand:- start:33607 stop:34620 length:1014 start_codon:yes stop_codon:yes gene_type:complete
MPGQAMTNKVVRVIERSDGIPGPEIFSIEDAAVPQCPADGCLIEVIYTTVDPAMRGWLSSEKNYLTVATGEIMRALGVGRVLESNVADYAAGEMVYGWLGWCQVAAVPAQAIYWKLDLDAAPAEYWLSALGLNGLTAWVGLKHLGGVKKGDTVLVSTCAGGVGSIAGQLAAIAGARPVGLTGGDEKVALSTAMFGYDEALNYRAPGDLAARIASACPDGIDLFFDNTAGAIADAAFPSLNIGARVVQCGTAAVASWDPVPTGPRKERDLLTKRLTWRGFIVFDHRDVFDQAFTEMKGLIADGRLTAQHEVIEGLDEAPGAIRYLYEGRNSGRLIVKP